MLGYKILCKYCVYHTDGTILRLCAVCNNRIIYEQAEWAHAFELFVERRKAGLLCPYCNYQSKLLFARAGSHTEVILAPSLRRHPVRAWFHVIQCPLHSFIREGETYFEGVCKVRLRVLDENAILALKDSGASDDYPEVVETERAELAEQREQELEDISHTQTGQVGAAVETDFKDKAIWLRRQALSIIELSKAEHADLVNRRLKGQSKVKYVAIFDTKGKAVLLRDTEGKPVRFDQWKAWNVGSLKKYFRNSYCRWQVDGFGTECGEWIPYEKSKRRRLHYCEKHATEYKRAVEQQRQEDSRLLGKKKLTKREKLIQHGTIYVK